MKSLAPKAWQPRANLGPNSEVSPSSAQACCDWEGMSKWNDPKKNPPTGGLGDQSLGSILYSLPIASNGKAQVRPKAQEARDFARGMWLGTPVITGHNCHAYVVFWWYPFGAWSLRGNQIHTFILLFCLFWHSNRCFYSVLFVSVSSCDLVAARSHLGRIGHQAGHQAGFPLAIALPKRWKCGCEARYSGAGAMPDYAGVQSS